MSLYRSFLRPLLFEFDPEFAHNLALAALKFKSRKRLAPDDPVLHSELWGMSFPNPLGMAAGFDKNADVIDGLFGLGFGFVEAGTITPRPQSGNPKPRMFRLVEDEGVINRLGFNEIGRAHV